MDTALSGAMDVFWRQGYQGTNLPELLGAMGLTRGSFYKAFDDKESAYLAALDQYDRIIVDKTVDNLARCRDPDAATCLSLLFEGSGDPTRGCFICNAMVELAPFNPQVADKANQMAARLQQAILQVLTRHKPDLESGHAADLADVILHLYFGHQAIGKARNRKEDWLARLRELLN